MKTEPLCISPEGAIVYVRTDYEPCDCIGEKREMAAFNDEIIRSADLIAKAAQRLGERHADETELDAIWVLATGIGNRVKRAAGIPVAGRVKHGQA